MQSSYAWPCSSIQPASDNLQASTPPCPRASSGEKSSETEGFYAAGAHTDYGGRREGRSGWLGGRHPFDEAQSA